MSMVARASGGSKGTLYVYFKTKADLFLALERLEPVLEHPLGLVLQRGDVGDDLVGDAATRGGARGVRVGPPELVLAESRQFGAVDEHV